MKIEFIKRGAETRLILIFAGWSTDCRFYSNCIADGWDTAVVYDYSDITPPEIPAQYSTIYIFAYSLGVWAASISAVNASVAVAVCGSPHPVSDDFGIPRSVFMATADGLSLSSLSKFHLRMAGNRQNFNLMSESIPTSPDIESLKDELLSIAGLSKSHSKPEFNWHRAYIASQDRIFPPSNLHNYWDSHADTQVIDINSPHYIDIASIIKHCIPDTSSIGNSFLSALQSYRQHAIVQTEVCNKIGKLLSKKLSLSNLHVNSLLEIGPGHGLLTEVWSKILAPHNVTFVDLYSLPPFGKVSQESYFTDDAEEWLLHTDEKFDVILSASAIQWFANPIGFIKQLKNHLNPGGFAIISTFTSGNFAELDPLRPSPIIYHSIDEYKSIENAETLNWSRTLNFDSPRSLLLHLKNTGVTPSKRTSPSNNYTNTCVTPSKRLSTFDNIPLKFSALPSQLTYTPLILILS